MKTDRLIGILSVLLQKEKCTAPELAERFEVSRRTINRDIDGYTGALKAPVRCFGNHLSEKRESLFQTR